MEDTPPRRSRNSARGATGKSVRNVLLALAAVTAAVVIAGMVYGGSRFVELLDIRIGPGTAQPGESGGGRPAAAGRMEAPPPGLEESGTPLGMPEPPPYASDSYRFLAINGDGTPVGYSPCRPLHYVVNAELVPAGAQSLIPDAIDTVSGATGIRFIYDGASSEQPSAQRAPYQPETYGDRWAPLLIAWTTPEVAPQLKGKVIGTGGSTHFGYDDGPKTFVTGSLELDAAQIAEELELPDGKLYATAVILHELSHVMGLEHVDDHRQLMFPEIGTPEGLAAGDLNGLYALGSAPCRKDL
ncbi:MAG: peptidase and matrixin and adamalysin [Pseudarthrobacter sp.]|nr:peptidase and matrixin and adamalysin [Pseudarthrobacter sp.]